jgi:protein-tyrosine phosphatase
MYRITPCLSIGPFPSPDRVEKLLSVGVTHLLNVSDTVSDVVSSETGFKGVDWVPMSDSQRLPFPTAISALDALHRFAATPGSHVYVHCVAGLVRSPTILWLYLISLGVSAGDARKWIQEQSPMANAGSERMVDREHVLLARKHGLLNFLPHKRPELVLPFDVEEESPNS